MRLTRIFRQTWICVLFLTSTFSALPTQTQSGELSALFSLPGKDDILGPVTVNCVHKKPCRYALPDTLESQIGIPRISIHDVSTVRTPAYVAGTLRQLGIDKVKIRRYIERRMVIAKRSYDSWKALPRDRRMRDEDKSAVSDGKPIFQDFMAKYGQLFMDYAESPRGASCSISLRAFSYVTTEKGLTETLRVQLLALLEYTYRNNCMSSLADPRQLQILSKLVYFVQPSDVVGEALPLCSGFLIGRDLVVTARHCLLDPQTISNFSTQINLGLVSAESISIKVTPVPGKKVVVISEPGKLYKYDIVKTDINNGLERYNPFIDVAKDIAVIRILGRTQTSAEITSFRKPVRGEPIEIPGLYVTQSSLLSSGRQDTADGVTSVYDRIRIDTSPECRVAIVVGTCLAHACQTEHGFSGTPMFGLDEGGKLSLIGVHTGTFASKDPACGFSRSRFFPNYGIGLNDSALNSLASVLKIHD